MRLAYPWENKDRCFVNTRHSNHHLLRNKIAQQNRIITKTQHEARRLHAKACKAERELCRIKAITHKPALEMDQKQRKDPQLTRTFRHQHHEKPDLLTNDAHLRALVESSIDHIFILDKNGRFIFSNKKEGQFNPGDGKELVGKLIRDVHPKKTAKLFIEKFMYVFSGGEGVSFHHETESEGEVQHHLNMLYPIYHKNQVWAVGGICRDISDLKRIEKQLFQSQKMEALGTLVAGVAHEINNPMNLILFNLPLFDKMWNDLLPLMQRFALEGPRLKIGGLTFDFIKENLPRLISDMEMAANRVVRIVSGLKDFSRKSNPADKSLIQVNQAVENASRLAGSTLSKSNTTLTLDLAQGLPPIHANLQNLEQIILNLMINAMQSIDHDHGDVMVTTREVPEKNAIHIQVADNGRGVNPAFAEKIFDPFVTDRQAIGGTGLGLSVTYNLVKAHDGDISFKSETGVGTQFTVSLPVTQKVKPKRIMVVDDDKAFRKILAKAISIKTACIVETYANGAEALIRLGQDPPDLLVLDMFMPEIDGLGVCRAIKNELSLEQTKVYIVTGFPEHPNVEEAARMGFGHIFTKPLSMETFLNRIKQDLNGIDTLEITDLDRR